MPALIRLFFSTLISIYQITLSPDHGALKAFFPAGVCRFHPTCSRYAKTAISHHGWRGLALIIYRLARCHPFSPGGLDPVPIRKP